MCFAEIAANGILEDFPAIHVGVEGGKGWRTDAEVVAVGGNTETEVRRPSDINGRKLQFPLATNAQW